MEGFDFPSHGVLLQFFDGSLARVNRKIGEQLPLNLRPPLRSSFLGGMDDRQSERGVVFLLSDRWSNQEMLILDPQHRLVNRSVLGPYLYPMNPLRPGFTHFIRDGVISIASQTIGARSDQETCPKLASRMEEFIDIDYYPNERHPLET